MDPNEIALYREQRAEEYQRRWACLNQPGRKHEWTAKMNWRVAEFYQRCSACGVTKTNADLEIRRARPPQR